MPHPGTQELARRMQSVPRTSRGFQTLLPEIRALRTTLVGQNDKPGLIELAEKVRLWAPGEKAPAVTARALAEAADVLADAGQWERAAALLDRAVQANPLDIAVVDRAHTVLSRGKAFEELHDLLTQHAHLLDRKAPSEEAVRASSWQRVGKLRAEKLKNLDAAIAAYDTAMQIQPEVNAVRELAALLETRGKPDDRDGAADLYCLLGELLGGDEGAVYYARALNLNPQHPDALAQLGASPAAAPAPALPTPVRGTRPDDRAADSRFAATVLQFPTPAAPGPAPLAPNPFGAPLPPPGGLHAAASAASAALHQPNPFGAAPQPAGMVHLSMPQAPAVQLPMQAPALDLAPAAWADEPAPFGNVSGQRAAALRPSTPPQPVPVAPSFSPDGQLARAPSVSEITWSHETRKARRPWGSVLAIAALAGVVAVGAVKRDELRSVATRTMALVGLTQTPRSTPLDETLGAARGSAAAEQAAPAVAAPAVEPQPVVSPAPAPAAAAAAPAEEKAAPAEEKAAEEKKNEGGEVSLVKGSMRAQGGKLPRSVLSSALEPALAQFDACYDKALAKKRKLEGTLQLSWVVRPSGRVDRVQKSGGSLKDASTIACVTRALKQADYPKPRGGAARLKASFEFER